MICSLGNSCKTNWKIEKSKKKKNTVFNTINVDLVDIYKKTK